MNPLTRRRIIAILAITVILLSLPTLTARSAALGNLQVSFLNVGQGDSELLRDANGFDVLIDGGQPYEGPTVVAYLRNHAIDSIDVLVASHSDSDHIGGLISVLQATDIPINAVVVNGYPGTTDTWNDFMSAVAARGLTPTVAQFPADYQWGDMSVHVLNPPADLSSSESNDASLVLRVDHGDVNFLFTGDISSSVENQVIARGTPIAAEILKVGHHGSAYSSDSTFLSQVGAEESIIEVGQNGYGHPAPDTLMRLASAGSAVWRTDKNGNIVIVSNGITYTLSADTIQQILYIPAIFNNFVVQTPVPTVVPTTPVPDSSDGNISITSIFSNGAGTSEPDEYVVIQNVDDHPIQVQNWTLRDIANHVFVFPAAVMQPGQVCRVYTNQSHPESCGFNYGNGAAIWNNGGDCAYLKNAAGQDRSSYCY